MHEALLQLCKEAMNFKDIYTACWDWLFVVPLCHFLSGLSKPFASIDYMHSKVGDRAVEFGYSELRGKLTQGYVYKCKLILLNCVKCLY